MCTLTIDGPTIDGECVDGATCGNVVLAGGTMCTLGVDGLTWGFGVLAGGTIDSGCADGATSGDVGAGGHEHAPSPHEPAPVVRVVDPVSEQQVPLLQSAQDPGHGGSA